MAILMQNNSQEKVTQKTIADLVGVRQSTVSSALRGTGNMSDDVREHIRKISEELGYVPNANASSLRSSSSDLIGVVSSPLDSPYHANLVQRIAEKLEEYGFRMLLSIAGGSEARQRRSVMDLLDQRAAGAIVCTEHPKLVEHVRQTLQKQVPMVLVGADEHGNKLGCDLRQSGILAGQHFVDIGRKKLVCIKGKTKNSGHHSKEEGFSRAVTGRVEWLRFMVADGDDKAVYESTTVADQLLEKFPDVDGIFAFSDAVAAPLISRLIELGKRVPEDIAVIGFDGLPQSRFAAVPLTTIAQPIKQYARRAVNMIMRQIGVDDNQSNDDAPISCELIVRKSTNPDWISDSAQQAFEHKTKSNESISGRASSGNLSTS